MGCTSGWLGLSFPWRKVFVWMVQYVETRRRLSLGGRRTWSQMLSNRKHQGVAGRKRKHLLRFTTQLVRTKRVRGDLFASSVPWRLCVQSRLCCTSACSVVKRLYRGTFVSGGGIQTRGFVWKFLLATCMRSVCRLGQSNSRENWVVGERTDCLPIFPHRLSDCKLVPTVEMVVCS